MNHQSTTTKHLIRSILVVALMLMAAPVQAADYVFMYKDGNTYNFLSNGNQNNAVNVTVFNSTTCIWTGSSNSNFKNQDRYIYYYSHNSTVQTLTDQSDNFTISNTNHTIYYNSRNYGSVYLRYNNGTWVTSNTNSNNAVVYTVSGPAAASWTTPLSISGSQATFTDLGAFIYTASAALRPAYYTLTGASTYYAVNGGTPTESAPSSTSEGITYTWTFNDGTNDDGHVRINSTTGEVTYYDSYATNTTKTIKVTATHTASGATTSATKAVTFNALPEGDPVSISATDITIPVGSTVTATNYTLTAEAGHYAHRHVSAVSGNTSIATIAQSGDGFTITGVAIGTVTITVNAYRIGNSEVACTATFTLTVREPETGVSGGTVTLNDYEDHNWTYYSGVPSTVDGGNYNTNYLGKLYSPNPRNVKITYKANGGAVSLSESETEFVYYKTLEEGTTSGQYPYQVISNPFSKRPNGKGFGGWKIKEGADYISGYNDEAILPLDAEIVFTNLPYPSVNCTSAEIELEATWVNANIYNLSSWSTSSNNNYTYNTTNSNGSSSGTYETNILVIDRNYSGTITSSIPVTIMMAEPDGSSDYSGSYTFTGSITPGANIITKIENAHWQPGAAINAGGRNLTIGRGMTMDGTRRAFYCLNSNNRTVNQVVKIESGNFSTFTHFITNPSSITKQWIYFGNDYDRAKKDNTKLSFTGKFLIGDGRTLGVSSGNEICRVYSISGRFLTGITVSNANADESYYFSVSNNYNSGYRYLEIIGGEWMGSIAGGIDNNTNTDRALTLRMRGGSVEGSIYGAAQYSQGAGTRTFVFTGGTVKGWVAGGANGTASTDGELDGATYIYVGGHANMNSNSSTKVINRAIGGNVFGAGCGFDASSSSGQVSLGTNVVVADEAYIERGVYGGGSYGYCATNSTSNVYITGGNIACRAGGVNGTSYLAAIDGGVYGGASQNKGGSVNLYVSGGTMDGSVYGGSNYTGVLSGGTNVQLHGGTINGSIYGGGNGKGGATNITTAVAVKVYGGSVTGAVYGCNNVSGAPQSTVTVDVYGTDPAPSTGSYAIYQVFGGGNQAAYSGTPAVKVHCTDANKDISVEEIYGGGNQAEVAATNVTIEAGNIIGNVYGGGRQADVNGNTSVVVNGGTVRHVFGGNNISGNISGSLNVNVNKTSACPLKIGQVFGGGNEAASQVGNISIACTGTLVSPLGDGERYGYDHEGIGAVYGGANNADIDGDISLTITSGIVDSVFGGNNAGGVIDGDITVTINKNGSSSCASDWYVGYVFGGGNMAEYTQKTADHPVVNVQAGKVTHHVFGGGNGADAIVNGNPQVTLSNTAQVGGNVFGGGNAAEVKGSTNVMLKN